MKRGASKSEKPKWDGGGDGKKEVFSPLARSEILDGGGGLCGLSAHRKERR